MKVRVVVSAELDVDDGWKPSVSEAAIAIYEAGEKGEVKFLPYRTYSVIRHYDTYVVVKVEASSEEEALVLAGARFDSGENFDDQLVGNLASDVEDSIIKEV